MPQGKREMLKDRTQPCPLTRSTSNMLSIITYSMQMVNSFPSVRYEPE